MLAAFIGFEVIRRVSPLLHTPLMSLTNALDAIAVVGAIVLVGEAQEQARHDSRHDRNRRCHQQYRRRLPDHRPHAENVQVQPARETMNSFAGSDVLLRNHLPDRQPSFSFCR